MAFQEGEEDSVPLEQRFGAVFCVVWFLYVQRDFKSVKLFLREFQNDLGIYLGLHQYLLLHSIGLRKSRLSLNHLAITASFAIARVFVQMGRLLLWFLFFFKKRYKQTLTSTRRPNCCYLKELGVAN